MNIADYLISSCLILPLPLLAIAWSRSSRKPVEFSLLTLSAVLLWSGSIRSIKLTLLGADYSNRLYRTIELNLLLVLILGLYLALKRRWVAAIAAVILALAWVLVGAINSAV